MTVRSLGQAHSPPREEGWLRLQADFGEAHLSVADGVVAHKPCFVASDLTFLDGCALSGLRGLRPASAPSKVASRHFLNVASTPPHKEGNTPICTSSLIQL